MNLIQSLNCLVDWHWGESQGYIKLEHGISSLTDYRNMLGKENESIQLIRDISDAHKHFHIERKSRVMSSTDQVNEERVGLGQALGLRLGGGDILAVTLDSSETRYFDQIASSAMSHWKQILRES